MHISIRNYEYDLILFISLEYSLLISDVDTTKFENIVTDLLHLIPIFKMFSKLDCHIVNFLRDLLKDLIK